MQNLQVPHPQPPPVQPKQSSKLLFKKSTISPCCALITFIIAFVALILSLILHAIMQHDLFLNGLSFVYYYQQNQPQEAIKVIQNIISLICSFVISGIIIALYFVFKKRRLLVFVHMSYFFLGTYLVALIRQSLQQPTPFWFDQRIYVWEWFCNGTSANPSGHCFTSVMLLEPMFSDTFGSIKIGSRRMKLWAIPLAIYIGILPPSRMYLGSHSSNQVLFGVTIGFILLVTYKFVFQRELYRIYWKFITERQKSKLVMYIIIVFVIQAIIVVFPIIIFVLYNDEQPLSQAALFGLKQKCGGSPTLQSVQGGNLNACPIGCLGIGLIYGLLLLRNRKPYRHYCLGFWDYQRKWKFILRVLILGLCVAIPYITFERIASLAVQNQIGKYLLTCFGLTLAGIGIVGIQPVLLYKAKIFQPHYQKKQTPTAISTPVMVMTPHSGMNVNNYPIS